MICCNSQKSKESLCALLHAKKLQKHTVKPGLVPEKLDTILTQPRKKGIRAQYDARRRAEICSKTPPGMKEYPHVIEWRLVAPQEARKPHEVGLLFRKIFLKGRRESFSDCGNPSGEHPPKNWILFLTWILFLKSTLILFSPSNPLSNRGSYKDGIEGAGDDADAWSMKINRVLQL